MKINIPNKKVKPEKEKESSRKDFDETSSNSSDYSNEDEIIQKYPNKRLKSNDGKQLDILRRKEDKADKGKGDILKKKEKSEIVEKQHKTKISLKQKQIENKEVKEVKEDKVDKIKEKKEKRDKHNLIQTDKEDKILDRNEYRIQDNDG